jgi:glycosyltransferase 2 family protein
VTVEEPVALSSRRGRGDWVRLAFLAAVVLFGVIFVARRWGELADVLGQMNWALVALSVVAGALGMSVSMLGWRETLADLGAKLPVRAAGRVFFVGQLGKYLPGSVWSFLAQAQLAKEHHVSRKATLTGSILGAAFSVATGLVTAIVLLPFGSQETLNRYWWVCLVLPLFVLGLHPRFAGWAIDRALRLARRQPLEEKPGYLGILRAAGWYGLSWVVMGLHAWLLVIALGGAAASALPITVGGFALAFCLGIIFIPAPAGAGIRDVALTVALSPVLGPNEALAVALVSRVMLAVLDFVMAGAAWLAMARLSRKARPVV